MKKRLDTKNTVIPYILGCIDIEGFSPKTDKEKLEFLAEQFLDYNYPNNVKYWKGNYRDMFADWISGLPSCFNIDFYNFDIIKITQSWGALPENPTDKQVDKIIESWFGFVAHHCMMLFEKNGINYKI